MVFTFEGTDAVLVDDLGDITVTGAAARLGVSRVTLSRVISGRAGISADMAYRLGSAFGTSPEIQRLCFASA